VETLRATDAVLTARPDMGDGKEDGRNGMMIPMRMDQEVFQCVTKVEVRHENSDVSASECID
jgi:hypothetical protein